MKHISFIFHDVLSSSTILSGFEGAGAERYKLPLSAFDNFLDVICGESHYPLERLSVPAATYPQENSTLLTFDDGGASCFDPIAERLESRGIRGRFFVVTSRLDQAGFLSQTQCRELVDRGHIIGSHSENHPAIFNQLPAHVQLREWHDSRMTLEQVVGRSVTSASVPGGNFSQSVAQSAAEAGYKLLFTSEPLTRLAKGPGDLLVAGRYMLTSGSQAKEVAALSRRTRATMAKRWLLWNARKALKRTMRPVYDHLRIRILANQTARAQKSRAQ